MQTRRDLYQAHKLMMQRVGLALLQGEPDIAESPMRRLSVAAFSGAMLAILIGAVFGIVGLIHPGGARGLDAGDKVIIEKETGTKYIYSTKQHLMLPVLNYASAKLAVGKDNAEQRVVSRKSLSKYTRGPMIGIPGAPDSLPDPDHLVKKPWSVCVRNGKNSAGGTRQVTSLVAGTNVGGTPLDPNEAVLVQVGTESYVIWQSQRMHMSLHGNELSNVTQGVAPATVSQSWLNPIAEGPEFAAPPIDNPGHAHPDIQGSPRNGQVYQVNNTWYVLVDRGFAHISETQARLLLSSPEIKNRAYQGQSADAKVTDGGTLSAHSAPPMVNAQLPDKLPVFQRWDGSKPLCSVYGQTDKGSMTARLTIGGTLPEVQVATNAQGNAVDQVLLPPGGAALVGLLPGEGQLSAINSWFVVNDAGISFPLPSKDTAKKLGYDTDKAAPIPNSVLSLIPRGPTLDPAAAIKPVQPPKASG
jgi:type VII secretion protein EccB